MMEMDIRWIQRFSKYKIALLKLSEAFGCIDEIALIENKPTINSHIRFVFDGLIKDGIIHRFEYTHELAWNVMKDYAEYQGNAEIGGSRDATREAFQLKLFKDGKIWMEMINSRNKTSHTYNEDIADEIYDRIISKYYPAFLAFQNSMEEKKSGLKGNIL